VTSTYASAIAANEITVTRNNPNACCCRDRRICRAVVVDARLTVAAQCGRQARLKIGRDLVRRHGNHQGRVLDLVQRVKLQIQEQAIDTGFTQGIGRPQQKRIHVRRVEEVADRCD
jgi:hypothetical protein